MGAMLSAKAKARLAGAVSVTLFTVFAAGMTANSHKTREEKERERAALAERDRERAIIGGMIAPRFPPPVRSVQQEWTSVPHWGRGMYEDGISVRFPVGWVFPFGTNHLSSVEVMSCGAVFPGGFSRTQVVSLGAHLSFVPGVSSFCHGLTPSNTYAFVWSDTRNGRIDGEPFDGRIEFFRNGDICVVTNGVSGFFPRELPFPHDGYGQDDEWVEANFTNATDIASAGGYAAWVDAQVGTGLTNGLYKLTVSVAEDPPETTQITVGDLSVAVTNAGEYVFLLEKGRRYDLSASSGCATNFAYGAVDDVAETLRRNDDRLRDLMRDGNEDGVWHSSPAELRLIAPFGFVAWNSTLEVSPRKWRPARANATRTFTAVLTDVPWGASPSYAWSSANAGVCSCAGANSQSATFTCNFPTAVGNVVSLGLDVSLNLETLHADYFYCIGCFDEADDYEIEIDDGDGCEPAPCLAVGAAPSVVFFETGTPNTERAEVGCYYLATEPGTFELSISGDSVSVTDSGGAAVSSGHTWHTDGGVIGARHFFVDRQVKSTSPSGTVFAVTFTSANSGTNTMTDTTSVTFVEVSVVAKSTWPSNQLRNTLGVFEDAYIFLSPMVQNLSLSGNGLIVGNGSWGYSYTAPSNALIDVVCNSDGTQVCSLDIIAPSKYDATITQIVNRATHACEAGSFEMFFKLYLEPKTVSFAYIEVMEQGMVATNAIGYFSEPAHTNLLSHSHTQGAWRWTKIGSRNNEAGGDTVGVLELPQPWGVGGFMTWPIPNVYRQKGGSWISDPFCNTDQSVTLEPNGTVWLEKFNYIESCTTNRQFNGWRRASQ